jgi:hypothetical protein
MTYAALVSFRPKGEISYRAIVSLRRVEWLLVVAKQRYFGERLSISYALWVGVVAFCVRVYTLNV